MSPTPDHDSAPPDREQALSQPGAGYFAEVPVYAGVLRATADTLELFHDFFTDADPVLRTHLGRYLMAQEPDEDIGDPVMEAVIAISELMEIAGLLRALAGDLDPDQESSVSSSNRLSVEYSCPERWSPQPAVRRDTAG